MPGSIKVSVLGLMDFPSPPLLSSLSLKVVMGKREYQTMGDGELSFPVMSLRENLVVALHDAEGLEILKTEFRTTLLLERGFWETLFPLKNGGSLHMKLQFSLSAEDQKRIREMRDLALKKKRFMENPWTKLKWSPSENTIGGSKLSNTQIMTENMAITHSELTEPGVGPYLSKRDKFLARRIDASESPRNVVTGERDAGILDFPPTMLKSFSSGSLPQISSRGKYNTMESFLLKKNCETRKNILSMNCGILGSKDLKIDKEFRKIEFGLEDNKLTEITSSHADSPNSAPSYSSIAIDTVDTEKSSVLAVSAKNFEEKNDFTAVDFEKGSSTRPLPLNPKAVEERESLNLIQKKDGRYDLNKASFKARIEHPYLQSSLVEVARIEYDENASRNPSNELASRDELKTTGKKHISRKWSGDGNAASSEEFNKNTETLDVNENNNEEQTLSDKFLASKNSVTDSENGEHTNQEDSSLEFGKTMNEEIMSQILSAEHDVHSNSYKKVGELNYDSEFSIGHSGTWTSRHLCITTRRDLLKYFPESFYVSSETNIFESSSI